jgi:hypothetical protein
MKRGRICRRRSGSALQTHVGSRIRELLFDATDSMVGSETFEMDVDSIKDIHNGATTANMEVNGSRIAQCGYSN